MQALNTFNQKEKVTNNKAGTEEFVGNVRSIGAPRAGRVRGQTSSGS